jgi:hypothetical protein
VTPIGGIGTVKGASGELAGGTGPGAGGSLDASPPREQLGTAQVMPPFQGCRLRERIVHLFSSVKASKGRDGAVRGDWPRTLLGDERLRRSTSMVRFGEAARVRARGTLRPGRPVRAWRRAGLARQSPAVRDLRRQAREPGDEGGLEAASLCGHSKALQRT